MSMAKSPLISIIMPVYNTGEILKKIKVKTSPDYVILDGDKLIVICYDTVYTYELK